MPIKLARMIQVGGPVYNWGQATRRSSEFQFEEQVGNSLRGARAGGRGGGHHALELPAEPDHAEGRRRRWRPAAPLC